MVGITIKTILIPRHDTSEKWRKFNPVLLDGEIGIETDTSGMKIGDGEHKWNELAYITTGLTTQEIEEIIK